MVGAFRVEKRMASLTLKNIKKVYPFNGDDAKKKKKGEPEKKTNLQITDEGVVAVQEFNLDIADKEFIVLVGPSGCGKSTTLRMIAGLEEISGGELYIGDKLVNDVAPKDRDIAMVFQNYALYPHMTVYDNIAFALKLRNQMRAEILTLRKRIDTTFVYVTHDQTEAMTLGDRIVIMKDGFIQQVGTPREVFAHPANQFVGGFIGTPQMNFFQGELLKENGRFWAQVGTYRVQLSDEKQERLFAADVQPQQVTVGVRPEHLQLAKAGIPAELGVREMMGSSVHLHLTAMEQDVVAVVSGMDDSGHFMNDIPASGQVFLAFHGNAVHLFDPASENNLEWPSKQRKVDSENFMEETVLPD